ncbi:MAG TPA: NAD-dependent deacylase [bacterium]|jgi:NAD-dependent deacetylase
MSSPGLKEIDSLPLTGHHLKRVVVLTGAGISSESGIPTFRGTDGFWSRFRPEELATPQAFTANPKLVWEWYLYRRNLIAQAQPNAGHYALVELEKLLGDAFGLITQNVDGLHQRAGIRKLLELHGSIFANRCVKCFGRFSDDALDFNRLPPQCPKCSGAIRPDVVWFGESLNIATIEDAFALSRRATLYLAIGTSAVVHPAATLPLAGRQNGAFLVEINPEPTPLSADADVVLRFSSALALPLLLDKIRSILLPC